MLFFRHLSCTGLLLLLLSLASCKNNKKDPSDPASLLATNAAYSSLNDSIRQFPGDASLFLRRGLRLTQDNMHELAYADFLKAFTLNPAPETTIPLAACQEILGKNTERLHMLDSMYKRYPDNAQLGRLLADAFTAAGQPDRALSGLNDMIARDSLNPDTWYEKAILLEQMKDTPSAIYSLQRAYALQPVDTYGLELAHLYAEQKNPLSIELCNRILKQDSAGILIDPLFIKGIYYANIRSFARALIQFDSCIQRDWKTTDAYLEKGRIYFQMKKYDEAMKTFTMAVTVSNTDPDAYFWLGRCEEALNRKADALSNYRKALSLDKNFTEARLRLDKLDKGFADPSH